MQQQQQLAFRYITIEKQLGALILLLLDSFNSMELILRSIFQSIYIYDQREGTKKSIRKIIAGGARVRCHATKPAVGLAQCTLSAKSS
jgi:hypothetical protein